jgi:uncharacterized metal-binding protein YceD (DUF177 family)
MKNITPEWPHNIKLDEIGTKTRHRNIEASAQECVDVARRLNVQAIKDFKAALVIQPLSGKNIIYVSGTFEAEVSQLCSLSDELVVTKTSEPVEGWFGVPGAVVSLDKVRREKKHNQEAHPEVEMKPEEEEPEPIIDGAIDLGELVVQHLSLAIDLYPQVESLDREEVQTVAQAEEPSALRKNPFAALKDWKANKDSK